MEVCLGGRTCQWFATRQNACDLVTVTIACLRRWPWRHWPIKARVSIPVLCTGGFQTASVIRDAITSGACDGVTIARPLIANNDLVKQFAAGRDRPERPCTYCNRCLVNVIENPLGCYEPLRYEDHRRKLNVTNFAHRQTQPA